MERMYRGKTIKEIKKKRSVFAIIFYIIIGLIVALILFKALMDDFSFSDLKALILPIILVVGSGFLKPKEKYIYEDTEIRIQFNQDSLSVIYPNVIYEKTPHFVQTSIVYQNIQSVQVDNEGESVCINAYSQTISTDLTTDQKECIDGIKDAEVSQTVLCFNNTNDTNEVVSMLRNYVNSNVIIQ